MTNTKIKLKKGDPVIVISGKDKGKKGEIIKVLPREGKVVVKGVNIVNRQRKANDQRQPLSEELPLHVCKVAYCDPALDVPTKLGFQWQKEPLGNTADDDGKYLSNALIRKVRVAKKSGKILVDKK